MSRVATQTRKYLNLKYLVYGRVMQVSRLVAVFLEVVVMTVAVKKIRGLATVPRDAFVLGGPAHGQGACAS